MEVLTSRVLVHPRDLERSQRFYEETLGLAVYHEWGSGATRGVVFFLGGGLLEVSGSAGPHSPSDATRLFLQVRDLDSTYRDLADAGVTIDEAPERKPWGLYEMVARDPDGLALVLVEVPPEHPLRRGR